MKPEVIDATVNSLDDATVRRLLIDAANRDEATARAVRLAAAGPAERLAVLRADVDSELRTRWFLGYWEATRWATDVQPVADAWADAAWALAHGAGEQGHMGEQRWKRLAEVRAATHPAEAMALWWELVDAVLTTADKAAYQAAVRYLKAARKAAEAADAMLDFEIRLAGLRETNRRRPSFIAMLEKAGLA